MQPNRPAQPRQAGLSRRAGRYFAARRAAYLRFQTVPPCSPAQAAAWGGSLDEQGAVQLATDEAGAAHIWQMVRQQGFQTAFFQFGHGSLEAFISISQPAGGAMMFLHAVYKEFRLLGRDLHGLAVLFAMPIAFMLIMSVALSKDAEPHAGAQIALAGAARQSGERRLCPPIAYTRYQGARSRIGRHRPSENLCCNKAAWICWWSTPTQKPPRWPMTHRCNYG